MNVPQRSLQRAETLYAMTYKTFESIQFIVAKGCIMTSSLSGLNSVQKPNSFQQRVSTFWFAWVKALKAQPKNNKSN